MGPPGQERTVQDQEVIGKLGTVVTRIRGGDLPGEVRVAVRGGTEDFIAYAEQEIPRDVTVLVFQSRGERAVDVVAYPEARLDLSEGL